MSVEVVYRVADDGFVIGIVYVQATSWIKNYANVAHDISEDDIRSVNFKEKVVGWQHILHSPSYKVWVAAEEEKILAFLAARKDGQLAEIYEQHTLPWHERQGLGGRLFKLAEEWLGHDTPIQLRIPTYAESGLAFYRKQGFKVDEEGEVDFVRLPSGKQITTVVMKRTAVTPSQSVFPTEQPLATTQPITRAATESAPPASSTPPPKKETPPANSGVGRAKLAALSGVRASTIKYYTEIGLLSFKQAEQRLARRYDSTQALVRLKAISDLRAQGKSIAEIKMHFGNL